MCDNSTLHLFGTPNSFGAKAYTLTQGELYFNITKPNGTMIKLTNPSKLHTLGWKHKVELEDGIRTMYEWYLGKANE